MTLIVDPIKEVRSCDRDFLGLELKVASQKELAKKKRILFSLETWGLAWPQAPRILPSESRASAVGSGTALWGSTASPGEQENTVYCDIIHHLCSCHCSESAKLGKAFPPRNKGEMSCLLEYVNLTSPGVNFKAQKH